MDKQVQRHIAKLFYFRWQDSHVELALAADGVAHHCSLLRSDMSLGQRFMWLLFGEQRHG